MIYRSDKKKFFTREYPEDKKGLFRAITISALQLAQNKIDIDAETDMNIAFFKSLTSESAFNHWTKNTKRLEITENGTLRLTKKGMEEIDKSYERGDNKQYGTSKETVKKAREAMLNVNSSFEFTKKVSKS